MDSQFAAVYAAVDRRCARPAGVVRPKILIYSHDTFGLGNIRRSLLLAEVLGAAYPRCAILLMTGSPMIHAFRIPDRMDYVKLPCVDRIDAEAYQPRFLADCGEEVRSARRAILERTAVSFQPDLVIVDKRAGGVDGEMLPALSALRGLPRPPQIVLGMRDILDAPETTRRTLRANGSFETIERFYDEVWIYGSPEVFDAVVEYDFPTAVARRTRYCGYLRRRTVRRHSPNGVPRVLVTAGGGGDGEALVGAYLRALDGLAQGALESVIVLGPHVTADTAANVRRTAALRRDVECVEFEPDLTARYEAADVVISMSGFNTVCELLTAGVPAVLVPRAAPVEEQLIRARRLHARGCFRMVEPAALTPALLLSELRAALHDGPPAAGIDLEGLTRVRARVARLLEGRDE